MQSSDAYMWRQSCVYLCVSIVQWPIRIDYEIEANIAAELNAIFFMITVTQVVRWTLSLPPSRETLSHSSYGIALDVCYGWAL